MRKQYLSSCPASGARSKLALLSLALLTWTLATSVHEMAFGAEKIPPQKVSGNIRWIFDYAAGKEEAKRSGRPMFVVFRCER